MDETIIGNIESALARAQEAKLECAKALADIQTLINLLKKDGQAS